MSNVRPNMTSLNDYEAWLVTLDKKLFLADGSIRSEFEHPISIPLRECTSLSGVKLSATRLRETLKASHSALPMKYLIERFLRLAIEANRAPFTRDQVMAELRHEWNIKNEYSDL
jgi:hypothetical protein